MRRILLVIAVILTAFPMIPANAQEPQECDPAQLQEWIEQRQAVRQATQNTLDAQGTTADSALLQLADHLQGYRRPRAPGCADGAMLGLIICIPISSIC
jgi:hypothetical protein